MIGTTWGGGTLGQEDLVAICRVILMRRVLTKGCVFFCEFSSKGCGDFNPLHSVVECTLGEFSSMGCVGFLGDVCSHSRGGAILMRRVLLTKGCVFFV